MVLISSALGGCTKSLPTNTYVNEESPVKTLMGVVNVSGDKFLLISGKKSTEITSRKLNLGNYTGKEVTVVGEFSGTTLYVDEVKP